jgi:hypothetical protein
MTAKKLSIFLAESSLETLSIIGGKHDDVNVTLSSAVNLCVQFCRMVAQECKIPLTQNELLFCCDILNGGAHMTEFKDPDSVSISTALESMKFSLQDAAGSNYGGEVEKWGIDAQNLVTQIELMEECELFALAFATRQFWAVDDIADFKKPGSCSNYHEWASQWVDLDRL